MTTDDFARRVWSHLTGQVDSDLTAARADFCERFEASYHATNAERGEQGVLIIFGSDEQPDRDTIQRVFNPGLVILLPGLEDD